MSVFRNLYRRILEREMGVVGAELDRTTNKLRQLGEEHALVLAKYRALQARILMKLTRMTHQVTDDEIMSAIRSKAQPTAAEDPDRIGPFGPDQKQH